MWLRPACLAFLLVIAGCPTTKDEAAREPRRSAPPLCTPTVESIPVDGYPSAIAADEDALWLLVNDGQDGFFLQKIDPVKRRPIAKGPVIADSSVNVDGFAVGAGNVWVPRYALADRSRGSTLIAVDTQTNHVASMIPLPRRVSSVAVARGLVWVPNENSNGVSVIDPVTKRILRTIRVGSNPGSIRFAEGAIWVTAHEVARDDGALFRIDPDTYEVENILAGREVYAIGEGSLWAVAKGGDIGRFDLASRTMSSQRFALDVEPPGVAVGGGVVWFAKWFYAPGPRATIGPPRLRVGVWRVDPVTLRPLSETVFIKGGVPRHFTVAFGALWIPTASDQGLVRIEPC